MEGHGGILVDASLIILFVVYPSLFVTLSLLNGYLSCKCQRASLQFLKSAVVRYKKFNNGHMMIWPLHALGYSNETRRLAIFSASAFSRSLSSFSFLKLISKSCVVQPKPEEMDLTAAQGIMVCFEDTIKCIQDNQVKDAVQSFKCHVMGIKLSFFCLVAWC